MGLLTFSCTSVTTQADRLVTTCYNLKQTFSKQPKANQEIDDLIYLVRMMPPEFSAAGFFQIKRSTLLSVIGIVTAYFIIVVQLQKL